MYSFVKGAAALVVAATLLSACGHEKSGGGVALMDLTAVARATGQDEVIRLKADANRQEMMAQLQQTAAQLDQQITAERDKYGEELTPEQDQQIQAMTMQARQQLGQLQNQAQAQINQMEQELVNEFRDGVAPLAAEVAQSMGATIILAQDTYVFWYEGEIDITNEVIEAWKAKNPPVPADEATQAPAASEGAAAAPETMAEPELTPEQEQAVVEQLEKMIESGELEVEVEPEAAPAE